MGAIAQRLPAAADRAWLWEFVKQELTPYPGRGQLVARMVTASTLIMILCMTFRIPYGAFAGLYGLILSRESLQSTVNDVKTIAIGFVLSGAYVVVGAMLVLGDPLLRFFWVVATLFLLFYAISALSNYVEVARFSYLTVITIPLWDMQVPAEPKVEGTLWAVGAITGASVITLLLELVFAAFRRTDELTEAVTDRLSAVEEFLEHYADRGSIDAAAQANIAHLAMVGTSRLRRKLYRSNRQPHAQEQMGAVVALVGRLVDLAANLAEFAGPVTVNERERIRRLAQRLAGIRGRVRHWTGEHMAELPESSEGASGTPLIREMETTASLISDVFTGSQLLSAYAPWPSAPSRPNQLRARALLNPEHIKFGLKGCLAASLCYMIYNGLFWPGISTSVTTCLLTALSTVGASHQKQVLRFAGALVGGFGIGMGSQIFILPYIDSIGGFTLLFVAGAFVSAWFSTSSSRLSYFGLQIAVAFYLVNLQEFKIQTSLVVARDRVVGVLLGLFMMWLAFDRIWSSPTGVQMKKTFISTFHLLAQLARGPVSTDLRAAIERSYALRETIDLQFNKVRSLADGVLFDFGPSRQQDLAFRDSIRRWQPQLRGLFLMRIALLKYRFRLPGFELPDEVARAQQEFDDRLAGMLDAMANRLEGNSGAVADNLADAFERLNEAVAKCPEEVQERLQTFLALSRKIQNVAVSLDKDM
jgi:multidrug resistance protein MdtO